MSTETHRHGMVTTLDAGTLLILTTEIERERNQAPEGMLTILVDGQHSTNLVKLDLVRVRALKSLLDRAVDAIENAEPAVSRKRQCP